FILFGQPERVVTLAQAYLHALSWGLLANFIAMVCLDVLMGVGYARVILIFSILTVAFNITFSSLLIFGKLGFPALGIAGAGWGMTISAWVTLIVLVITILLNENYRQYFQSLTDFTKPAYLWELVQVGLPMGLMYCIEVAFFFALTLAMGMFGT